MDKEIKDLTPKLLQAHHCTYISMDYIQELMDSKEYGHLYEKFLELIKEKDRKLYNHYYILTDLLADELEEKGECILKNVAPIGGNLWIRFYKFGGALAHNSQLFKEIASQYLIEERWLQCSHHKAYYPPIFIKKGE